MKKGLQPTSDGLQASSAKGLRTGEVEDNFIDLVDCLLGPTGGFKLSLDYGANFEAVLLRCLLRCMRRSILFWGMPCNPQLHSMTLVHMEFAVPDVGFLFQTACTGGTGAQPECRRHK